MRENAYYKDESRIRGGYMSRGGSAGGHTRGRNLSGDIRTIKDALQEFKLQRQSQISTVPSFDNESFPALERHRLFPNATDLSNRTILPKIGLTGQFCFSGVVVTKQLKNLGRLTVI